MSQENHKRIHCVCASVCAYATDLSVPTYVPCGCVNVKRANVERSQTRGSKKCALPHQPASLPFSLPNSEVKVVSRIEPLDVWFTSVMRKNLLFCAVGAAGGGAIGASAVEEGEGRRSRPGESRGRGTRLLLHAVETVAMTTASIKGVGFSARRRSPTLLLLFRIT